MTPVQLPEVPAHAQEWPQFSASRYPYTYAYDLLRNTHPLDGDNSRGEMSAFVSKFCLDNGMDKEALCRRLADIHIAYERDIEAATRRKHVAILAAITQPEQNSGR